MARLSAARVAHIAELPYTHALIAALNAPNRQTRVWRQNVGSVVTRNRAGKVTGRFSAGAPVGTGDILGVVRPDGWHIEVETKSHKGKQSEEQIQRAELLSKWGAIYVLCGYSDALSMDENVAAAVSKVDAAIAARRIK